MPERHQIYLSRFCNLFYTLSIKRSRFSELKLVMITIGHLKNILSTSDDSCLRFIHFNTHKYKAWTSSSFFSIPKHFCSCQVNVWSRCCERFHFVNHWRKTEELSDWQRDARWKLMCLQMEETFWPQHVHLSQQKEKWRFCFDQFS